MVLTPDGEVARYLFGIDYPPKDLRLALVEAGGGRIGSPVDQVLLYCFHYDPATGKYTAASLNLLRAAGVLTVLALGTLHRRDAVARAAGRRPPAVRGPPRCPTSSSSPAPPRPCRTGSTPST